MSHWGDEGPVAAGPIAYGGFWRRVGAAILDAIILWLPTAVILQALGLPLLPPGIEGMSAAEYSAYLNSMTPAEAEAFVRFMLPQIAKLAVVGAGVNWTYFALLESSGLQATLGKMTFGLRVTDLDGGRISFARATGRFFGKYLSSLILCIGYLMVAFTEKKQALHDMLAGTLVIRHKTWPDDPPPS